MEYFIDVILPIPLRKLFTYKVNRDEALFLKTGMRVAVSFGKSKLYSALVYTVHNERPILYEAKEIEHILDEEPIINILQLELWKWIADYYMCSLGEVCRAALPNVFMLESETIIERTQNPIEENSLTDDEYLVCDALNYKTSLTVSEVSKIVNRKNVLSILNALVEKQLIVISEKFYEKYVPKLVSYMRLQPTMEKKEKMNELFAMLSNAPKQRELLLKYFNHTNKDKKPIAVKSFLKNNQISKSIFKSMVDKGIFEEYHIQKDRIEYSDDTQSLKQLSEVQEKAFKEVKDSFEIKDVVLLHGVTASGKTEIYVKIIEEVLQKGKQVLYLLPEIAITTQLINRLKKYFGNTITVYHSKFSSNERAEVWRNILNNSEKARLIIGVRSSVLLPFRNLGLVVVDEEHEKSFKQFDPAPRYHARDCAIVLGKLHDAKVLLGSATPSLETYYNTQKGKYGLVNLTERFADVLMPNIELIDIKDRKRRKKIKGNFSEESLNAITETLEKGKQVILFQNRRGYAPIMECNHCGSSPQCPNCDVSLTYHQYKNQLRCHYCGYVIAMPKICPACSSSDLDTKGLGTEQVELEVKELFPKAVVDRMDQDTTRGKYGYDKIIAKFEQQETDILVGTQMVSKGLDFEKVRLVGVLNADNLLHFPEFKASERCFQTLTQVSGRSGRSKEQGKVLIQTHDVQNPIFQYVKKADYQTMAKEQLAERAEFSYPPYVRLIKITFKHRDFNKVNEATQWFFEALRNGFHQQKGIEILGPEFPPIARIRNEYMKNILLKIKPNLSLKSVKEYILRTEISFHSVADFRPVRVIYNVDTDG